MQSDRERPRNVEPMLLIALQASIRYDAIGIPYQQGLKRMKPAFDLVEGSLSNANRPRVRNVSGKEIQPSLIMPHFNEVDESAGIDTGFGVHCDLILLPLFMTSAGAKSIVPAKLRASVSCSKYQGRLRLATLSTGITVPSATGSLPILSPRRWNPERDMPAQSNRLKPRLR